MNWKIALSEPSIGEEEIKAVTEVLRSKWLTMGSVTAEFERRFAEKMQVKHAFAVNNCTAALHLANLVLGVGTGDEVICPALTFVATANATRYTGANVVFADVVSEHDLTIDPEDIEKKITKNTKAISVVHYGGFACDMERILAIAKKHNLKIIEDCAHAPFAKYQFADGHQEFVGSIGNVGCFSFFGNKNMTTGEGGMITTNDDDLAAQIKLLRSHGMTTLTYDRHKGHASTYDVVALGYNYRTDEIHSAIGLCQLDKIDELNKKRREIFQCYINELKNNENVFIPFSDRDLNLSSCHILELIIKNNLSEIKQKLFKEKIQSSKHYELISNFNIYQSSELHTCNKIVDRLITLPLSPNMEFESVKIIVNRLHP
jgi:dTDP-4-amino-4,6-dideoxygalactose transaminase